MIHAGLGHSSVKNFMAALNVPCISQHGLKKREREVGEVIEKIASESTKKWLQEEILASKNR